MNELMLFGALSAQRTEAALLRGNAVTERFGLTLTPEQCGRLLERRAGAAIQRLGGRLRGPHRRSRWPRDAALCAHGKGGGR